MIVHHSLRTELYYYYCYYCYTHIHTHWGADFSFKIQFFALFEYLYLHITTTQLQTYDDNSLMQNNSDKSIANTYFLCYSCFSASRWFIQFRDDVYEPYIWIYTESIRDNKMHIFLLRDQIQSAHTHTLVIYSHLSSLSLFLILWLLSIFRFTFCCSSHTKCVEKFWI